MKHLASILTIALTLFYSSIHAEDFSSVNNDGLRIYYNILSTDQKTVEVEGARTGQFSTIVNIPDSVNSGGVNYAVKQIGQFAFNGDTYITSINIPATVEIIGNSAFKNCTNINELMFGKNIKEIGNNLFENCLSLRKIELGDSLKSIGDYTFLNCTNLDTLTIGRSIQSLPIGFLKGCTNLHTLYFNADSCTKIGTYYDEGSTKHHFSDCPISKVTFGNNVSILPVLFLSTNCNVDTLYIPASLENITIIYGYGSFDNWNSLKEIIVDSANVNFCSNDGILYSKDTTILHKYPASKEDSIFHLPTNVTEINIKAFENATHIDSIYLEGTTDLTINGNCFNNCTNLIHFESNRAVNIVGGGTFDGTAWLANQADGIIYFGNCAYSYKGAMPDSTHLEIKDGIATIGINAFQNQKNLHSIKLPNSLTKISNLAFALSGLKHISIPESVETIGFTSAYGAFERCDSLRKITFEGAVKNIQPASFLGCNNIDTICCLSEIPPHTMDTISDDIFEYDTLNQGNIYIDAPITVVDKYLNSRIWNRFHNYPTFKLTFDANNDSTTTTHEQIFTACIADTLDANTFELFDYTFKGWTFDSLSSSINLNDRDVFTLTQDTTLYAIWSISTYLLNFDLGYECATRPDSLVVMHDSIIGQLPIISRDGYVFDGWKLAKDTLNDSTIWKYRNNDTAHAMWTANIDTKYKVIHKQENIYDDNYTEYEVDSFIGKTDSVMNPTVRSYIGFTSPDIQTSSIKGDNSTIVEYLYKRTRHEVRYEIANNKGASTDKLAYEDIKYGANTPPLPRVNNKDGYTFVEWSPSPNSIVNKDIVYTAQFTANSYILSFNSNGGNFAAAQQVTYDTEIGSLPTISQSGYSFSGWEVDGAIINSSTTWKIASNKTATARWTANSNTKYTVIHKQENVNDDDYTTCSTETLYGTTHSTVSPETKTFSGFSSPDKESINILPDGSTSLTYLYKRKRFKVEFIVDKTKGTSKDALLFEDIKYQAPHPSTPTITGIGGHNFKGWNPTISINTITSNLSYTAQFSSNSYILSFDANGGSFASAITVTYDIAVGQLPSTTRIGYTFVGWEIDGEIITNESPWKHPSNMTAIAIWKANNNTTFKVNHKQENIYNNEYTTYSTDILKGISDEVVTPQASTFTGFISPQVQTVKIAADGSTEVNYLYRRILYNVTYIIDATKGSSSDLLNYNDVKYNTNTPTPPTVNGKDGYIFSHWSPAIAGTVSHNTTYTAEFTEKTYLLNFDTDGGSHTNSITVRYNYAIGEMPSATKAGYTFTGWKIGNDIITSSNTWKYVNDQTAQAIWTANTNTAYTVIHKQENINNDDYSIITTENLTGTSDSEVTPNTNTYTGFITPDVQRINISADGSTIITYLYKRTRHDIRYIPTEQAHTSDDLVHMGLKYGSTSPITPNLNCIDGYTFNSWQPEVASIITSDATYTATFTANSYTLTLNANGGNSSTSSITCTYDATISSLPTPTRIGYTFDGWQIGELAINNSTIWQYTDNQNAIAKWNANTNTPYVVNHLQENIENNEYNTFAIENLSGTSDSEINPAVNTYTGFVSPDQQTATVNANGSTIVNYHYTRTRHNINFIIDTNKGTSESTLVYNDIKYDAVTPNSPNITTLDGYTFKNWNPNIASTVKSDMTYTAEFTANSYVLSFDANGGTFCNAISTIYNETTDSLPKVNRIGYNFTGWYIDNRLITQDSIWNYPSNKTAVAQWAVSDSTRYSIIHKQENIYDNNYSTFETEEFIGTTNSTVNITPKQYEGFETPDQRSLIVTADGNASITIYYQRTRHNIIYHIDNKKGSTVDYMIFNNQKFGTARPAAPNILTNGGYDFVGWNPELRETVDGNEDYYANFEANTFLLNFDAQGGNYVESKIVTYDKAIGTLSSCKRTGYTFKGWKLENISLSDTTIWNYPSNKVAIAQWEANHNTSYAVIHRQENIEDNGYTIYSIKRFNDTTNTFVTPAVNHYKGFISPEPQTVKVSADGTTEIVYNYIRTLHNVSYIIDKKKGSTENQVLFKDVKYGSANPTSPTVHGLEGYTFKSWTPTLAVEVTNDLTYTAEFNTNSYTLSFNTNGGVGATDNISVIYNEEIGHLPTVSMEGYTFAGWYIEEELITENTVWKYTTNRTAVANWIDNYYYVIFDSNGGYGIMEDQLFETGTPDNLTPNTYLRDNYKFLGWSTDENASTIEYTDQGIFTIANSDVVLYAIWEEIKTSTEDINETKISLYPNPCVNILNVECDIQIETIELYDTKGTLINKIEPKEKTSTLDVSNLSDGIYILSIKTENGKMFKEKFIRE